MKIFKAILKFANSIFGKTEETVTGNKLPVIEPHMELPEVDPEKTDVNEELCPMTLDAAFRGYIQEKIDDGSLSQSTLKGYDIIRRLHFQNIMQIPLDAITADDLQAAFDLERENGASRKTLLNYRGVMKKIMAAYAPEFQFNVSIDK